MTDPQTYRPNVADALFFLRLADVVEEILTRQGIENARDVYHTAMRANQLSFRPFEAEETTWLEILVAAVPLGRVALRDVMPDGDAETIAWRQIVAHEETGDEA